MSLYQLYLDNQGNESHKWNYYFPIYEEHFSRFRNQSILLFEIGVFHGGSLPLWKKWLGPLATIVGIDINPACKQFEEADCHVRIGNQSDPEFLKALIQEFGLPSIVIDDGSHLQEDMLASFAALFPYVVNNGVYLIEDTHACYWPKFGGGLRQKSSFIEKCKDMIDTLHAWHYVAPEQVPWLTRNLWSLTFYDSIIVFEKKAHGRPQYTISPAPAKDAQ
ncbi:MAG: class I SAM-dependent methyltransferase [Desulfovibrio sp.]|nr:class I SAM-dependent methyltransferase [Desulfovibrio sp.]